MDALEDFLFDLGHWCSSVMTMIQRALAWSAQGPKKPLPDEEKQQETDKDKDRDRDRDWVSI